MRICGVQGGYFYIYLGRRPESVDTDRLYKLNPTESLALARKGGNPGGALANSNSAGSVCPNILRPQTIVSVSE